MTRNDPGADQFIEWLRARSRRRCVPPEFTLSDMATYLRWPMSDARSLMRSLCTIGKARKINSGRGGEIAVFRLTERDVGKVLAKSRG